MSANRTTTQLLFGLAVPLLLSGAAVALEPKQPSPTPLAEKEFFKPELAISSANIPDAAIREHLPNKDAVQGFTERYGSDVKLHFDPRSGTPSSIVARVPFVPGSGAGNTVTLQDVAQKLGRSAEAVDDRVVGDLVRTFVSENRVALGVDITQLGPARAAKVTDDLWHVSLPQEVNGIPVRHARIAATIGHGNLVLLGTESWGNVRIDTEPQITAEQALAIGFAFAGGRAADDELWAKPALEIVPFAPPAQQAGESFAGPVGQGYGHKLVWAFGFLRKDEIGRWEVLVDARTGEVLALEDRNQYETKSVTGGIYPLTSTEVCPSNQFCGTMQPDSPMPFANTGLPAPNDFTNSAGLFDYPGSGTVATTLNGRYLRISDTCGAINESSANGDIDLGGVNGQHDCASAGASAGDTPASRSAFYEVNKLIEMARGWLPSNTWLQGQLTANVNLNQTCNAFYDFSTINFFKSGGGCRNTGELAAVFDHEWGHGLDDNDTNGSLSSSSEAYADIAAILRLQASCVGHGFFESLDDGCGRTSDDTGFNANESQTGVHCILDCSGVRDSDWDLHADHLPDTPQNFVCGHCISGSGPCGRQVHCSAAPSRQAAWDFVARDLQAPPFNYSSTDAFIVANKIFYQGSGNIGSWHACSCPSTADGCGATNAYMQWLAADDDNGNLADGTPHMSALYAAFDRHNIACATPAPVNGGCAGGPTAAPSLSASPGSNQLGLSWTPVADAVSYRVLRSEGYAGCDFGKAVIATVSGTSYTDPDVANGRAYSYIVQAVGSTGACFGPSSACVTGSPQPCAGALSTSDSVYNCNDTIGITLVDSDLIGAGSQAVTVRSTTESRPETLVLGESPAGSGRFTGAFPTSNGAPATGDGLLSVSHGDTITVAYVDASFCGIPDVPVERTAPVDCQGPVITNVRAENVTGNSADIKWDTDEAADSQVVYGLTIPPGSSAPVAPAFVTTHTLRLQGIQECSTYYYGVASTDPAGNGSSENNGRSYFTFETGQNVTPTFAYGGAPVPIPDNNPVGAEASFFVADSEVIVDVNVLVHVTHTYDGDLVLSLRGPDNTTVTLSNRRGGGGNDFNDTVFDDEAATPIAAGSPPYAGVFRPDQALSAFDGQIVTGTWTFRIVDQAGVDVGTIDRFEINFTYPPQACGPSLRYESHATTDACDAGGGGDGNNVVEPGETIELPVTLENNGTDPTTGISAILSSTTPGVSVTQASSTYPDLSAAASSTGNAAYELVVDPGVPCGTEIALRLDATANEGSWTDVFTIEVGTPGTATTTHGATDVPKPIPDTTVTTSTIAVTQTATVTDVNVGFSLTHTYDGDLDIFLVGPTGTRVELTTDNGGSDNNFTGTVFDDEAASSITTGSAPFTGSFRPEQSLSALDGSPSNGNWTLEITDDAGADVGTLTEWHIELSTTAPPVCNTCSILAPPGEVLQLDWAAGKEELVWTSTPSATSYNLYRGGASELALLMNTTPDSCLRLTAAGTTSGSVLLEEPATGELYWYLVRAENSVGEGSAGNASAGPRTQNSWGACP